MVLFLIRLNENLWGSQAPDGLGFRPSAERYHYKRSSLYVYSAVLIYVNLVASSRSLSIYALNLVINNGLGSMSVS